MTTPLDQVPPGVKNPEAWLRRRIQRACRRPRVVNYPVLAPGEQALGLRRKHGQAAVIITREPLPQSRSKYGGTRTNA